MTSAKKLSPQMNKIIRLGEIDRWLRGLADMVAKHASALPMHMDHLLPKSAGDLSQANIEDTIGFRRLIASCALKNTGLQVEMSQDDNLNISFPDGKEFSDSVIFGVSRKPGQTIFSGPAVTAETYHEL